MQRWVLLVTVSVTLGLAAAACHDSARPGAPEGTLGQVTATYLCGNDFALHNAAPEPATVRYTVVGTAEEGELTLPPGSPESSTTRLTTLERGALRLAVAEDPPVQVENSSTPCPAGSSTQPQATLGEWSAPFDWPSVAVHLHLLPGGRVLSWGRQGVPQVYDPNTGSFAPAPSSTMVFCAGHTFLADGRLLVSGGHLDDRRGLPDANVYDGRAEGWAAIQPMHFARWYPTNTTLANGEVLALAGTDAAGEKVEVPEIWDGSSWRLLPGARRALPYYPRTFVAPNGLVFYAGELQESAYLDPAGEGRWISVGSSRYGRRDYGSAVMYAPGKVMILGGSDPPDAAPTATVEVIDLNSPAPSWRYTESMSSARRHLNATLLPDGQVLVTGGTSAAGFSERSGAVRAAEIWNPDTEQWKVLAQGRVSRVYHSTTLLLPDGRVLHAGSGDGPGLPRELSAELYSPPYLFHGPRPVILEAASRVGYDQPFLVTTPSPGEVVRVTLVRLASVTHAFDQSQRFVELSLQRTAGGLTVRSPASGSVAPPGPYLLAILNGAGVPSVSRTITIE